MPKKILFDTEARQAMLRGMFKAGYAVIHTFGPRGGTAMLDREHEVVLTKDGITVLDTIELMDAGENTAVEILQEASRRTNDEVGDGTTTTVLFACVLARELNRLVVAGHPPVQLAEAVRQCQELVEYMLLDTEEDTGPTTVETEEDIRSLILIASNHDTEIADLLTEVFVNIGQDGTIVMEDDKTLGKTYIEYDEGMVISKGYLSPHFINTESNDCVLEDCKVLICTDEIYGAEQIRNIITEVARDKKSLLIIAGDVREEALQMLILNNQMQEIEETMVIPLQSCAIKTPMGGERRVAVMRDIAAICGATVVGTHTGFPVKTMNYSDLGEFKQAIIKEHRTVLMGGAGTQEAIDYRLRELQVALGNTGDDYERERIKERVAKMIGAIARVKIGAQTQVEQKQRKSIIEDAVFATQAGIRSGITRGGGKALWSIANLLPEIFEEIYGAPDDLQKAAIGATQRTIRAPALKLFRDSDLSTKSLIDAYNKDDIGLDAHNDTIVDLYTAGIVEPVDVVLQALINGFSAGRLISTGDCLITIAPVVDRLNDTERASKFYKKNWKHY